jgi:hypothetical protein
MGFSGYSSVVSRSKLRVRRTGNYPAISYGTYTQPLDDRTIATLNNVIVGGTGEREIDGKDFKTVMKI